MKSSGQACILMKAPSSNFDSWDRVVELSLNVSSGQIALVGCPDGPEYGAFHVAKIDPGFYRVRVYSGGQNSVSDDGNTKDHYLIEIWSQPSSEQAILKF